jgi:flagellar motility protein MotE (MotC chaperone)
MNQGKPRIRRVRASALVMISVLLIGSAILRVGVQAQPSLAKAGPDLGEQMPDSEQMAERPNSTPADLQLLVNALQDREQLLNQREVQIVDRMKALEIADEALELKLTALVEAEQRLSETLALADGASEGDLSRLTEVYQKMKPKEAAALFEEMAPEFAAGFLGRMRPESAASIMAGLSPKSAYTVSVILAGRNAWVPKE